jgi:hypothetical protein
VRLPIVEVNVTMIRTTPSLVVQMIQQEVMNESLSEGWKYQSCFVQVPAAEVMFGYSHSSHID